MSDCRTLEQCALELVKEWQRWIKGEVGRFNRIQAIVNRMTYLAERRLNSQRKRKRKS